MDGWMLGKCCLFGVSDLFLTFPGVFFNFKKSARAIKLGTIFRQKAKKITGRKTISQGPNSQQAGSKASTAIGNIES